MVDRIRHILNTKRESLYLMLVLCLGTALRFFYINSEGLWYDEALTALSLRLPFSDMVSERLSAGHSPLYFSLLYPVSMVFGTGEIALRLPSAVASILSLFVFWRLGKRLFSDLATVTISSLFFALSAMNIYFGQEARMYAFCVLAVLCSFLFLIRALDGNRTVCWIYYVIAASAAINLSSSVIPVVFAQLVYALIRRELLPQYLLALAAIVLLYIPMGLFYLRMGKLHFIEWLAPVTAKTFLEIFYGFGFRPVPSMRGTWMPFLLIRALEVFSIYLAGALLLWGAVASFSGFTVKKTGPGEKNNAMVLLLWLFVPLLLEYVYSVMRQPMLGPKRYVIALSPAYYFLLGGGLRRIPRQRVRRVASLVIVALFVAGAVGYYSSPKRENWRDSIAYLDERFEPGEVVFGNVSTETMYHYYGIRDDVIILDVRHLRSRSFAKGWIMIRDMDRDQYEHLLTGFAEARSVTPVGEYSGIGLYRFE
jgi:mannosyltransferase